MKKKVYIETYGCQMNEYDTELVKTILRQEDYEFTDDPEEAEIVLLNTCSVRENANRKVYNRIHQLKSHGRGKGRAVKIGILGCMATNFRQQLLKDSSLPIDFIAGPDSYKRLPRVIQQVEETGQKAFDVTLSEFETYADVYPTREGGVNAWIAVMRGCDNFCTFCVVPYTRGRERSRDPENVVEEVRRLAAEGFRQVTLLGQNVNSYNFEGRDFAYLLERVSEVEGIERIRFTSPHPKDFPDRLLEVIAWNPKVCKQIHLPLQAGSDRILALMNRTYTQAEFLALVEKIRSKIPQVVLTTDIIVGFCTETDEDFRETVRVVERVEFDSAFIFKYSERPRTIAARKFKDDVPEAVKTERIVYLNELQKQISYRKNCAHVGQVQEVLIEQE
ncbi:MAG: tRNA (N6-isopentenyl adenosine(37)-C2)-methylthiotransferase MiaB, partial [Calditrichaeota bacterium]